MKTKKITKNFTLSSSEASATMPEVLEKIFGKPYETAGKTIQEFISELAKVTGLGIGHNVSKCSRCAEQSLKLYFFWYGERICMNQRIQFSSGGTLPYPYDPEEFGHFELNDPIDELVENETLLAWLQFFVILTKKS